MSKKKHAKKVHTPQPAQQKSQEQVHINPENILTPEQKDIAAKFMDYVLGQPGSKMITFSLWDGDKAISRRVQFTANPSQETLYKTTKELRNLVATGLCLRGCTNFQFRNPNVLSRLPWARVGFMFTDGGMHRMPVDLMEKFGRESGTDESEIDFQMANLDFPIYEKAA